MPAGAAGGRSNGAWHFADCSYPAICHNSQLGFMPRVRLTLKVNKTVLRAAYGRYVIPLAMTQPFQSSMPTYGYTATTKTASVLHGIAGAVLSEPFPASNPLILPNPLVVKPISEPRRQRKVGKRGIC